MNKKYFIIFIALIIFTYWRWFFDFSILSYGDWRYFFHETQKQLLAFPLAWENGGFGNVGIASLPMYPVNFLWGFLSYIFNFAISERILYFYPSIIISALGSFFLIKRVVRSSVGAFLGSLVFTYNTYFLLGRTGHLTLIAAFAVAPLALLFFMKTLEEKRLNLAVITGLLFFVVSFYEIRAFYILAWICFFYFLLYVFLVENSSWKNIIRNSVFAFIPIALVVLLNLYWIAGFLKPGVISDNAVFSRGLFGNSYMNIEEALTLFHPFWTGGGSVPFIVQPIPIHFFLIPIFAFLGLILNRKNKDVVFFGIIALIGIFLSKQVGEPFPNVYPWLFKNFPGFNAFREASKFYFVVALGYSVLIGAFISWLWQNWNKNQWRNIVKYSLTFLIAGLFLWNTKPLITGEIGTLFVPRHIPNDYLILKDFILKQDVYFRTLWIPVDSRWGIYVNNHPKINGINISQTSWSDFSKDFSSIQDLSIKPLEKEFSNNLVDNSSIKYVIAPLRDSANDDDFFINYGGWGNSNIRDWYISELDKIEWLKKIDIGTKELVVYENENYKPHIYSDSGLNYYQTNVSEFGDFSQNQNLYLNSGIEKHENILGNLSNIIIPIEADPNKVAAMKLAVDNASEPAEKDKLQNDLELYTNNSFLKDFKLKIPVKATYKIYFKSGSVLANNKNISVRIDNSALEKDETGMGKEGWDYFNQIELDKGEHSFGLYVGNEPVNYINPGDVVLTAENLTEPIKTPQLEYKQVNPTKYIVNVQGASTSFPLVFSESFHPDWKIYENELKVESYKVIKEGGEESSSSYQVIKPGGESGKFISANNQGTIQNENLDGGRFYDLLFKKPVLDDQHLLINGFANAWWVDLAEVCKVESYKVIKSGEGESEAGSYKVIKSGEDGGKSQVQSGEGGNCIKNADGSYDFSITIEFEPQRFFYIGLLISSITLLGCLSYLAFTLLNNSRFLGRRRKERNALSKTHPETSS